MLPTRYEPGKLVRDRAPEQRLPDGTSANVRTLDEREYVAALRQRLHEATRDYLARPSLDALADLREVVDALACAHNADRDALAQAQADLRERDGGYDARLAFTASEPEETAVPVAVGPPADERPAPPTDLVAEPRALDSAAGDARDMPPTPARPGASDAVEDVSVLASEPVQDR